MKSDKKVLLKTIVGSQAHGLADENSDYDYRAVYILPTSDILKLGYKYKGNDFCEGKDDNTAYEMGHFLFLATKCNPTILEVFKAPIVEANEDGKALRRLFLYIWEPKRVFDAFVGYGLNQRKKFLDKKDNRKDKYAVAYIRTLVNLIELLRYGHFNVKIESPEVKKRLLRYKNGDYQMGEIIDESERLTEIAKLALHKCEQVPNLDKVNEFLIRMRKKYW